MNESASFRSGRRSPPSPRGGDLKLPSLACGLTSPDVTLSRRLYGSNGVKPGKKEGFLRQFFKNLNDPIIKILIAALVINTVFTFRSSGWAESVGIALTVLISALVTTLSEHSSGASFEKLYAALGESACRVLRDGEEAECPASSLVRYDLVLLRPGDTVPADGILARGLIRCDESPLTGESRAVTKSFDPSMLTLARSEDIAARLKPGDGVSVFRGSHVVEGNGMLLVLRVGEETLYGSIAGELTGSEGVTPLKERLSRLARTISRIGYVSAALVMLVHLADAFWFDAGCNPAVALLRLSDPKLVVSEIIHAVTLGISILVVAVPEGLPMMITVVLSSNMKRMMRDGVLVRRLVGIETAGSVDMLFTDKTGTLTTGQLAVSEFVTPYGTYTSLGSAPSHAVLHLRQSAAACASVDNQTERALNAFAARSGKFSPTLPDTERIPFSSERKFAAGRHDGALYVRGAPEIVLPACRTYFDGDGREQVLTPAVRMELEAAMRRYADQSARLLLHAQGAGFLLDPLREHGPGGETPLCLVGFSVVRDELRTEAHEAVRVCREAGVQVVMITGDNADTAASVARAAGILPVSGVALTDPGKIPRGDSPLLIDGPVLRRLSDEELTGLLPRLAVVSRVTPTDKSRLIRLSKAAGHIVGMTGDGINDAPALKAADVGFAMGSGTDVAREAGDIVITDDNIVSINKAILYGRTIFASIRKFITYQLTMNFAAVGVCVLGTMFGIENPVTVIQMLWVNMIMDTLGSLAFAGEPALPDVMHEPPVKREEPILTRSMAAQIALGGGWAILLSVWFLLSPSPRHFFGGDSLYHLTLFFALFVFMGIGIALCTRTPRIRLFSHLAGNRAFAVIMPAVAAIQLLIVYFGGEIFRCVPLRGDDLLACAALAFSVVPVDIIRKCVRRLFAERNAKKQAVPS